MSKEHMIWMFTKHTREEFLDFIMNLKKTTRCFNCPNDHGFKSFYDKAECLGTENCRKCWNKSVEHVFFKNEKLEYEPYCSIYNLMNDYKEEVEFVCADVKAKRYKIQQGVLLYLDVDNNWVETRRSLQSIINMKFEEAIKYDKKIRYYLKYIGFIAEQNEFLPLNDTIKNIGEAHHSDIVRKIIENGEWFI